jgi:predicted porin
VKKLLPLSALLMSVFAVPAMADVSISGKFLPGIEFSDNGEDSALMLQDFGSRIGFSGSDKWDNGLTGYWTYELAIRHDLNAPTTRNAFVGFQGDFGKAQFGTYDTPYKELKKYVQVFETNADLIENIFDRAEPTKLNFYTRAQNQFGYHSPVFSGFQVKATFNNNDSKSNGKFSNISSSVFYDQDAFFGGLAYEVRNNVGAVDFIENNVDHTGLKAIGGFKFGDAVLSGGYNRLTLDNDGVEQYRDAYLLTGYYKTGKHLLKASFVNAGEIKGDADIEDSGANAWSLGWTYSLSKQTQVHVDYSTIDNDTNANYKAKVGSVEVKPSANGEAVNTFAVALTTSF